MASDLPRAATSPARDVARRIPRPAGNGIALTLNDGCPVCADLCQSHVIDTALSTPGP